MNIQFGALAPSITKQLKGKLPPVQAKRLDALADSITRLGINGVLTDREVHNARKRLVRIIARALHAALARPAGGEVGNG